MTSSGKTERTGTYQGGFYWQIGNRINVELLQGQRAQYGKQIVSDLAQPLTVEFGKGWSERQLRYCLRVAEVFPDREILHTLCSQLSWTRHPDVQA